MADDNAAVERRRGMLDTRGRRRYGPRGMAERPYFYGWNIVAVALVMAMFSWGLGFYGASVYLATLQRLHGWSSASIATPITVHYLAGAVLVSWFGDAYARFGPRWVVATGAIAMAASVAALGVIDEPWQLYPAFLVMAFGWAGMSAAALNTLIAPWFERQRGLAISVAYNGASLGGVIVAPALIALIGAFGFAPALAIAAAVLLAVMLPLTLVLLRGPELLGLWPDGERRALRVVPEPAARAGTAGLRGIAIRAGGFWSVCGPFGLALTAQVGLITHLVALLVPNLGEGGAARAVGFLTIAAIAGRVGTGIVIDRLDPRMATSVTLAIQIVGVALLIGTGSVAGLYIGAILFGLGVGNLVTLPSLILQREWPRDHFATLISLSLAINQVTFAFGPALMGVVRDWSGAYGGALLLCAALQTVAGLWVLLGPRHGPASDLRL